MGRRMLSICRRRSRIVVQGYWEINYQLRSDGMIEINVPKWAEIINLFIPKQTYRTGTSPILLQDPRKTPPRATQRPRDSVREVASELPECINHSLFWHCWATNRQIMGDEINGMTNLGDVRIQEWATHTEIVFLVVVLPAGVLLRSIKVIIRSDNMDGGWTE